MSPEASSEAAWLAWQASWFAVGVRCQPAWPCGGLATAEAPEAAGLAARSSCECFMHSCTPPHDTTFGGSMPPAQQRRVLLLRLFDV